MTLFDLSHPLTDGMPVYPGDPGVKLQRRAGTEAHGYLSWTLQSALHCGTHVDLPLHFCIGGTTCADLAPERFCGEAQLVDLREKSVIAASDLDGLRAGVAALLFCGWDAHFGQAGYFTDHPALTPEAGKRLVEKKIPLLGMDLPSPDRPPFTVHKLLLEAGIPLVENLRGLDGLAEALRENPAATFLFEALPLRIAAEASPVRAVARLTE